MRRKLANNLWLFSLLLAAFLGVAEGQDVSIPSVNPYVTLTRGAGWGATGNCSANLPNGGVSQCGVNNTYVWTPPTADSSVCIAITNQNPSSSHSITMAMFQTLDASVNQFSGQTQLWATIPAINITFPFTIPANSTSTFFYKSQAAAKLALQVTGATAAGGNPDSANILVVQPSTASTCGSAPNASSVVAVEGTTGAGNAIAAGNNLPVTVGGKQNVTGSETPTAMFADVDSSTHSFLVGTESTWNENTSSWTTWQGNWGNSFHPQGIAAIGLGQQTDVNIGGGAGDTLAVLRNSKAYGLMTTTPFVWGATQEANATSNPLLSFQTQKDALNPAAGALLIGVNINNATNSGITPTRLTVSCSAACDYTINRTTSAGTTCSALTIVKVFDPGLTGVTNNVSAITGTCVANPTISQTLYHIWLAAGTTQVIDMTGYYWARQTAIGNGFDIQVGAALTGTMSATFEYMYRGGAF